MKEEDASFLEYRLKCENVGHELFPEVEGDDIYDLLWEKTSYPFGSFEEVEMQLHEFHAKGEKP